MIMQPRDGRPTAEDWEKNTGMQYVYINKRPFPRNHLLQHAAACTQPSSATSERQAWADSATQCSHADNVHVRNSADGHSHSACMLWNSAGRSCRLAPEQRFESGRWQPTASSLVQQQPHTQRNIPLHCQQQHCNCLLCRCSRGARTLPSWVQERSQRLRRSLFQWHMLLVTCRQHIIWHSRLPPLRRPHARPPVPEGRPEISPGVGLF